MEYEVYLRREAFEFLRLRHLNDREQLLALLHQLDEIRFDAGIFPSAIGAAE